MYTAQLTIERIQSLIKEKGYTQKNVLSECGINENTLKRMTDNKGISSFYLAKIADYLDCSVDYLLGRIDTPNISETYTNGDNSIQAVKNNGNVTISKTDNISNIGSFGDDVYKIGMTRRLGPMDRIDELSSASVPFEFDVHAMIFSEDAPALENTLHNIFSKYKVNKVNPRKEFFHVPLSTIKQTVQENFNKTVEWVDVAPAEQYRQSLQTAN